MTKEERVNGLMNDLMMLIESQECYNEKYYKSQYKKYMDEINALLFYADPSLEAA